MNETPGTTAFAPDPDAIRKAESAVPSEWKIGDVILDLRGHGGTEVHELQPPFVSSSTARMRVHAA